MMVYIWIAVMLTALIVEAMAPGLVAIWFVPAALVSTILAACGVPEWIQVVVFLALAVATILLTRFAFNRFGVVKRERTNVEAIVGEKCLVTERIENLAGCGQVKVHGMYWAARSLEEGAVLEKDDVVIVRAVEGVKLIVAPEQK